MGGPFEPFFSETRVAGRKTLTIAEELTFLLLQGLGALIWVFVTAQFVDVITNANPAATQFRQTIDNLNRFCSFHHLNPEMQARRR